MGNESDADPHPVTKAIQAVTPLPDERPNAAMDSIGWTLFLVLVVLLFPLLPFIAIAWAVSKLLEASASQRE